MLQLQSKEDLEVMVGIMDGLVSDEPEPFCRYDLLFDAHPHSNLCFSSALLLWQGHPGGHPEDRIPAIHVVGNHDLAFVAKDYWLTKTKVGCCSPEEQRHLILSRN